MSAPHAVPAGVDPARREQVARTAATDATRLAGDVRELDPRQVWQRLTGWAHTEPERLLAVVVALAAMVDVDRPAGELLAWTHGLTEVARR